MKGDPWDFPSVKKEQMSGEIFRFIPVVAIPFGVAGLDF